MSNTVLNNIRIQSKNDIKATWQINDPTLLKGEIGIEIDTKKFKIGDGVSNWNSLEYASAQNAVFLNRVPSSIDSAYDIGTIWINISVSPRKSYILLDNTAGNAIWKQLVTPDDLSDLGAGDMLKADFATNAKVAQGYVNKAIEADSLVTGQNITLSGDVTSSAVNFNGTSPITIITVLQNVPLSKITGVGTAASKDVGSAAGNVPILEANGKLSTVVLPPVAITQVWPVSSESQMLALEAEQGHVAIRSDSNQTFILRQTPANVLSNWEKIVTPTEGVISINGEMGNVVLSTTNISEGTNQYYTDARATTNFNTNFVTKSSTGLTDGATILHSTDTFILNGGTSAL